VVSELERRKPPKFDISGILFGPQLSFVSDTCQTKTAVCSRRAGKSYGCAAELLRVALRGLPALYFTKTRASAKRIMWGTLLQLNRKHHLGFDPNESELILKRNGMPLVYLTGADGKEEIEKWRGTGWAKAIGDEAQALPEHLKDAVEEVLIPSFMDHDGTLSLIGTPGPVPVGYFWECCISTGWSHHAWSVFDNPHIPSPRASLAAALARRGVTEDDPSIQREFFGRWAYDPSSLVFKYSVDRNSYSILPAVRRQWQHVVGVDLGYDDADAIAVLAWSEDLPGLYLVEESVERHQGITRLGERLQAIVAKYAPLAVVCDMGGLGKKVAEEVTRRTGISVLAAEKERKTEHIELVNDALRTGRFFAKTDSVFAHDAMKLEWDRDKSSATKMVVSDRFHSDILDAALYAFRRALHWLHEPPEVKPPRGSVEAMEKEADSEYDREIQRVQDEAAELKRSEYWG
jgi:hypothetical protein